MDTQRLILFVVFSFAVLLLWDAWQKDHQPAPQAPSISASRTVPAQAPVPSLGQQMAPSVGQPAAVGDGLLRGARAKVKTDVLNAVIDANGGDIRRLEFTKYGDSLDPQKHFVLFEEAQDKLYVAQTGLIGASLPSHRAQFKLTPGDYVLSPGDSELKVRLEWTDPSGLQVSKIYTFHRGSYVIDVAYEIQNHGPAAVEPYAYYQLLRHGKPPAGDPKFVSTYTGVAVYTDKEKYQKVAFPDIDKGKQAYPRYSDDGWIAMLQHYFLSAWLPGEKLRREFYTKVGADGIYTAGVVVPVGVIQPGASKTLTVPLYAGPQEQDKLSTLSPGLGLTVDYGWLTIIATPLFAVLSFMHSWANNWGVAIILLTILIKLVFFPLSAKSYRSMAQMRVLAPKLQKLKEQYGEDRQRLHQAMMELYKTEKVNPLGGCLPIAVQIPVFIALYWVLLASVEMRQAPFMLWIQDLSTPDPFYVLPVIMGITMIIQTRLNPTPPDPIQAKVMKIMPIAFSIFFFFFPAGLVLYWVVNNVLSITQQWFITRRLEGAQTGNVKR
jgi:YidC/Oxa1 family membrane protein insertase